MSEKTIRERIGVFLNSFRSGMDSSRFDNVVHGEWCVVYPDGQKSERMFYDVALSYASIFGGKVEYTGKRETIA